MKSAALYLAGAAQVFLGVALHWSLDSVLIGLLGAAVYLTITERRRA